MPGFDGTGPMGQGPMSGGGFGYCATGGTAGVSFRGGFGRGRGFGRGGCRGFGRYGAQQAPYAGMPQAVAPVDQKAALEARMSWLEQEAQRIRALLEQAE